MSVLIDTSVWVQHFKVHNPALAELVVADRVLVHPMVILELACGTPPEPRQRTLSDISLLRKCTLASHQEVMDFVEREKLYGLGCGLVDMTLLASTLLITGARIWTLDKRLANLADRFGVAYQAGAH